MVQLADLLLEVVEAVQVVQVVLVEIYLQAE
jgi:hypothetical protein